MEYFPDNDHETQNSETINNNENSSYEEFSTTQQSDNAGTNSSNNNNYNASGKPFPNVFALFARSLGVFSIFCAVFGIFFGSFICGGVAIVLAVLSKGYQTKMEKNAIIGLVAGCIAIVVQFSTLTFSVYKIINVPEYRELFNSMYEQMYGEPVDESITDMLDELGVSAKEGGFL